jgi:signal transduction histidine kinase
MNDFSEIELDSIVKFLLKTDYFKSIPENELYNLARNMKRKRYKKNEIIFKENEEGDSFYIIESGQVEVSIEHSNIEKKRLSIKEMYQGFGELSIIDKQSRSATVKCLEDTSLLILDNESFERLIEDENSFSSSLTHSLTSIVRNNTDIIIKDLKDRNELLENSMTQLQELQDTLVENERMIAVGRFANKMVHDLRNMLNQIFSAIQLITIKKDLPDNKRNATDYLGLIEEAVKRMNDMCTEVLEYSQGNITLNKEKVNIKEYLELFIKKTEKTLGNKKIGLESEITANNMIFIDKGKLNRVLNNIIYNSVDALSRIKNPLISIKCYSDMESKDVVIEISDNGEGIQEEYLDKVFEPFFTYGKTYGTGLGLSISKEIISTYHKGSININSEVGKGTTVTIKLPFE